MSDAARLLTKAEIDAIRGRVNVWPDSVLPLAKVIFAEDDWGEKETEMLRFAPLDIPALLAHIDVLESLLGDMAADEGTGAVLRMRLALEGVVAVFDNEANHTGTDMCITLAHIAREALQGPK